MRLISTTKDEITEDSEELWRLADRWDVATDKTEDEASAYMRFVVQITGTRLAEMAKRATKPGLPPRP